MSLIVTVPTKEGVVMASDAHSKRGQVQEHAPKIHLLNKRICWAATGENALIQRVARAFSAFENSNQSLAELITPIGNAIRTAVKDLLATDFRTEIYLNNLQAISQLHRADFVFTEWNTGPGVLQFSSTGSPEWLSSRPFLIGPGDAFAGSLLRRYLELELDLRLATVLAYRLLEEVIESGLYNVKFPIEIWHMTGDGPRKLADKEVREAAETVEAIRRHELAVFEKHLIQTVSH